MLTPDAALPAERRSRSWSKRASSPKMGVRRRKPPAPTIGKESSRTAARAHEAPQALSEREDSSRGLCARSRGHVWRRGLSRRKKKRADRAARKREWPSRNLDIAFARAHLPGARSPHGPREFVGATRTHAAVTRIRRAQRRAVLRGPTVTQRGCSDQSLQYVGNVFGSPFAYGEGDTPNGFCAKNSTTLGAASRGMVWPFP